MPDMVTPGKPFGNGFCTGAVATSHKLARPAAFIIDCLMTDLSEAQEAVHKTLLVVVIQIGSRGHTDRKAIQETGNVSNVQVKQ